MLVRLAGFVEAHRFNARRMQAIEGGEVGVHPQLLCQFLHVWPGLLADGAGRQQRVGLCGQPPGQGVAPRGRIAAPIAQQFQGLGEGNAE